MAKLKYYKYQNKNKKMVNAYQKWYGRVVINETVGIEEMAAKMQDNCTLKRADILAVLSELGPTMRDLLQDSKRVVLPYLGSFKLGINTVGAESENEFTVKNIKTVRVMFQPTTHVTATGRRAKDLTDNCRLEEYKNIVPSEDSSNADEGGSTTEPDIDDLP